MDRNIADIDTPHHLIFPERVDVNIREIHRIAEDQQVLFVPHVKSHLCISAITQKQLQMGASKFAVATANQAEVLTRQLKSFGIERPEIMIVQPIVDDSKLEQVEALIRDQQARIALTISDLGSSVAVLRAFKFRDGNAVCPDIAVELEAGLGRTGLDLSKEDTADLVQSICKQAGDRLRYVLTHGETYFRDPDVRRERMLEERKLGRRFRRKMRGRGINIPILTQGSTPFVYVFANKIDSDKVDEVRAGTYIFHDGSTVVDLELVDASRPAVTILATVLAKQGTNQMELNIGRAYLGTSKSAHERGEDCWGYLYEDPTCTNLIPEARIINAYEATCTVELPNNTRFTAGDRVYVLPRRTSVSLANIDYLSVVQDGKEVDRWVPEARRLPGASGSNGNNGNH